METENILRRHLFVMNVEQNVTINSLLRGSRSVMDKSVPSHAISVTTFNQINALSRHTRVVHSGIRPFPCEHCSFRGGQAYYDLVKHTKTMHPMVPTVVNDKDPRIYVFLVSSDDSVQHFSVI